MGQMKLATASAGRIEPGWVIQEAVILEREKEELAKEKKKLEEAKSEFDKKIREFEARRILDEKNRQHEKLLFETKFSVLETELKKLAAEKEQLEKEKSFYKAVNDFHSNEVLDKIFFKGVDSVASLKKRYKDLIKIYHPDNANGDNCVLQEINDEYESLKDCFEE